MRQRPTLVMSASSLLLVKSEREVCNAFRFIKMINQGPCHRFLSGNGGGSGGGGVRIVN